MIRIDEIYNHTFWPWIENNIAGPTRMWFCDPFGSTDPNDLYNYGKDIDYEQHYIFFHDQEPIHLDTHTALFDKVRDINLDIVGHKAVVTSEYASEFSEQISNRYGWKHYYYFFHGWAALDWFRGYDRSFLIQPPEERKIAKSFLNPNRIIGGKRDHRVLLLYHLFRNRVKNAWISCPNVCPYEQVPLTEIAQRYIDVYPDIIDVFDQATLPLHFPGEDDHPMHSCWLSLFDRCHETLTYVVTETVFHGKRNHITEKTFKPICQQLPFVLVSTAGSLEYLRTYGFKTFSHVWNEDYDLETDDLKRLEKISALLLDLDSQTPAELNKIYQSCIPVLRHNYEHFYGGAFEKILWNELNGMLTQIKHDFRV